MRRGAAPLAVALCTLGLAGCGGSGAGSGAPAGATLVLDFMPNAVHSGLFAAQRRGYFERAGLELEIRTPSSSADGAKLLAAGRAQLAVLDLNDFGIARERGLPLVAIAAIVQRPLASVIAAGEGRRVSELAGATVGVTGVPSDDAVLDTVLRSGGVDPGQVDRVTIGFNAVAALAASKVDAATAFWSAEGVQLTAEGVPTTEFRVDEYGAPRYPELVVATTPGYLGEHRRAVCAFAAGLRRGYRVLDSDPEGALDDLLTENPGLDRPTQARQLDALLSARAFSRGAAGGPASPVLDRASASSWVRWAVSSHLLDSAAAGRRALRGFRGPATACPAP